MNPADEAPWTSCEEGQPPEGTAIFHIAPGENGHVCERDWQVVRKRY